MARRIGIFGGTFDPVHLGHVALVVALQETHGLDLVLIIPAYANPHKLHTSKTSPAASHHRLQMVHLAFADVPKVQVLAIEIDRQGPSYTIDTVHVLYEQGIVKSDDALFLLMGQDQLQSFATWKSVDELVLLAKPLIALRSEAALPAQTDANLLKSLEEGITATACYDISATTIRKRLSQQLFCGHLIDRQVYNYIKRHHLYE